MYTDCIRSLIEVQKLYFVHEKFEKTICHYIKCPKMTLWGRGSVSKLSYVKGRSCDTPFVKSLFQHNFCKISFQLLSSIFIMPRVIQDDKNILGYSSKGYCIASIPYIRGISKCFQSYILSSKYATIIYKVWLDCDS